MGVEALWRRSGAPLVTRAGLPLTAGTPAPSVRTVTEGDGVLLSYLPDEGGQATRYRGHPVAVGKDQIPGSHHRSTRFVGRILMMIAAE